MYKSISFNPIERQTITYSYTFLNEAFTPEECEKALEFCKKQELVRASVGHNPVERTINESIRKSNVKFIEPCPENLWLFEKLAAIASNMNEQFYNFNLNGFSDFQFTEYKSDESGHYDWHIDSFLSDPDPKMQAMRKLSISVLLNDEFEGGNFQIHVGDSSKPIDTNMKKGTAIVFPSFVGHRVTPVTKGNRYSIVVWVYGPKFI